MQLLTSDRTAQVARLLRTADEQQTLRRYLRRQEAVLMPHEKSGALEILVGVCRDGYLPYETTLARARMKLGS